MYKIRAVIPQIKFLSWWLYAQINPAEMHKCRVIAKLLLGCDQLKSRRYCYKQADTRDPFCDYCDRRYLENASHLLFECAENEGLRVVMWQKVVEQCPPALLRDMMSLSAEDKTAFLLSGLCNTFINEWMPLYQAIANYIYKLYITRIC